MFKVSLFSFCLIMLSGVGSSVFSQCPGPVLYTQGFADTSSYPKWVHCIDDENTSDDYVLKIASPNDIFNYSIDWGDGTDFQTGILWPANTVLIHSYGLGKYTVTLQESNEGNTKSIKGIFINDRKPGATATPQILYTSGCVPHELTFINQSTNVSPYTKFTRTWGDGKTSQDYQLTQFYSNPINMNPGFAGTAGKSRTTLNNRHQWVNLSHPLRYYGFSFDHNLPDF